MHARNACLQCMPGDRGSIPEGGSTRRNACLQCTPCALVAALARQAPELLQVDRSKINEQFFSEIRNPNASIFDVVGRYLDNYGFLI